MEELAKKVGQVFTQYLRENLGNRVSQFGIKGLRDIVINEIKNYKINEGKKVNEEKKVNRK